MNRTGGACAWLKHLATGLSLLLVTVQAHANDRISAAPTPHWVEQRAPDLTKTPRADEVKNGQFYLLVERQTLVRSHSNDRYVRHAIAIVNEQGLEASSQITVTFDPSYESVQLHRIRVHRGARRIDQLDLGKVKVIQKEEELEYQLYDGRQTLLYLLEDLRVGDVVEYSYTLSGRNPALGPIYSGSYGLQWSIPVGEHYLRVVSEGMNLRHRVKNAPDLEVRQRSGAGRTEYVIHRHDVPPRYEESNEPDWYDGYPVFQLSSVESWQAVAEWALGIYPPRSNHDPRIVDVAERIKSGSATLEEQVLAAVRFVQDEIRYMGIELGAGSYIPSAPLTTLERRFGDCKDKSVLLVDLLSALGVESYPALVNSEYGRRLKNGIPSPLAFDHVIVLIELDGEEYWVDPTVTLVGGSLRDRKTGYLHYGLPIREGASLRKIPAAEYSEPLTQVSETFDASAGLSAPARFEVVTTFRGMDADYNRARFARQGIADIAKFNLEYYQKYYPTLELAADLTVRDDRRSNEFTVTESYAIKRHWEFDEESNRQESDYYTTEISPYLKSPASTARAAPYGLSHPVFVKQSTRILLPGHWDIEPEDVVIANDYFHFTKRLSSEENVVDLVVTYRSLASHVPPEGMETYARDVRQASDLLGLGLYSGREDYDPESLDTQSWLVLGYLGFLALVAIVAIVISFRPRSIYEHEEVRFHPVSPLKFSLLNIFTFNLYTIYWFAKGWRYLKSKEGLSVMPVMRGIFSIFFYSAFFRHLKRCAAASDLPDRGPANWQVYALHAGYVVVGMLGFLDGYLGLLSLLTFLFLMPMVSLVADMNADNRETVRAYARLGPRHYLAMFLGAHLVVSVVLQELHYIPGNIVIAGERLPNHEMKFLHRLGVVDPGENLELFYSDSFWSYRTDGNGLTDRRVFSYWKDSGDTRTNVRFAYFDQIDDLEIKYADSSVENTIVTVVQKDGEKFHLYLSNTKRRDREFVELLKKRTSLADRHGH